MRSGLWVIALAAWGCDTGEGRGTRDGQPQDRGPEDATRVDGGPTDAGPADGQVGPADAQVARDGAGGDARPFDAAPPDATVDLGSGDAAADVGSDDAGPGDAQPVDAARPECAADGDCDDGLYCTGQERCAAGRCVVEPVDCGAQQPACALASRCDPLTDRCEDTLPDGDGDGEPGAGCLDRYGVAGTDCDDVDPLRAAGQREVCDGVDNDCDGSTDEAYAAELEAAEGLTWPDAAAGANDWQLGPSVAGHSVISWSFRPPNLFYEDGFVAVLNAQGALVGAPVRAEALGTRPALLTRLGEGFAALWLDQSNLPRTVRVMKVGLAGDVQATIEVHRPIDSTQPADRALATDASGQRAVALWVEQENSGLNRRYRLQVRMLDAQLQPLSDTVVLSDTTAAFRPFSPAATWQGDRVVVAWIGGFELFTSTFDAGPVLEPNEPVQVADLPGRDRGEVYLVSTVEGVRGLITSAGTWHFFGLSDDGQLSLPLTPLREGGAPTQASLCVTPGGLLVAGDGPENTSWLGGFDRSGRLRGDTPTVAGGVDDPRLDTRLLCDPPLLVWRAPQAPAPAVSRASVVERCGPRCDDPRFAGPDCDQCADPRRAGVECDQCAEGFRGEDCALCVSPLLEGELCDRCRDDRYQAPDCVSCADPTRAGVECDRQRLLSISCGQNVSLGRKAPLGSIAKWGNGGNGTEIFQAWDLAVAGGRSDNYCMGEPEEFRCFGGVGNGITSNEPAPPVYDAAIGDTCACAVDAARGLYCWGTDPGGIFEVPPGVFTQVDVGWTHACAVSEAGQVICWGGDAQGQASPPALADVQRVEVGETFSCALHGEGEVTCWGEAADNRLRPPAGPHRALAVGRHHACAIDLQGALACWGAMPNGEAQVPAGRYTQLSAGSGFACALDETGAAACWGRRGTFTQPP